MDIKKHPILEQHYKACLLVEAMHASESQTDAAIALSDLGEQINSFISEKNAEIERLNTTILRLDQSCKKMDDRMRHAADLARDYIGSDVNVYGRCMGSIQKALAGEDER